MDTVEMELAMQKQIATRTLEQAKESQEIEVNKAYLAMKTAEASYTEAVGNHQKAKEYYLAIQENENVGEDEILMAYETMEAMKETQLESETIYNDSKANYDEVVRLNTQLVQSAQDTYDLSNASIGNGIIKYFLKSAI